MKVLPSTRPKQVEEVTVQRLREAGLDFNKYRVVLLGIRGYYAQSMGPTPGNDRGIYDDAIFVVSPTAYATFNANTDPSLHRPGVAVLEPGTYLFAKGLHGVSRPGGGYPALRQHGNVTVRRDGLGLQTDSAAKRFWINIHRGGRTRTGSEGCQTLHPDQWGAFINLVYGEMSRHGQKVIPYVLVPA